MIKKLLSLFQNKKESLAAIDTTDFKGTSIKTLKDGIMGTKDINTVRRYACKNPYILRYLNLVSNNVLGAGGIQLQHPSPMMVRRWNEWTMCSDLVCSGDWRAFQYRVLMAFVRDGEAIVQMVYPPGEGFRLVLIDTASFDRQKAKEGIKYDDYGRPVEYYFRTSDKLHELNNHTVAVPANQIIRVWEPEISRQIHGQSRISSVIDMLKELEDFEHAHVVNATTNSLQGGFIRLPNTLASLPSAGAYNEFAKSVVEAQPGDRHLLLEGMEWIPNNATFPAAAYEMVRRGKLSDIAAALGISYFSLASDLTGANYSSLRHGWQADILFYKHLQSKMIDFCRRVFTVWNGRDDERVVWTASGFPYLDPAKEANALQTFVTLGTHSVSELIRSDGRNPLQVFEEREMELEDYPHLGGSMSNGGNAGDTESDDDGNGGDGQDSSEEREERTDDDESTDS